MEAKTHAEMQLRKWLNRIEEACAYHGASPEITSIRDAALAALWGKPAPDGFGLGTPEEHPPETGDDAMPRDAQGMVRKVYMLSEDLAARVASYQESEGHKSEVEAVRHLLEQFFRSRESWQDIAREVQARICCADDLKSMSWEYLLSHPLVSSVSLDLNKVGFILVSGEAITIDGGGRITEARTKEGHIVSYVGGRS